MAIEIFIPNSSGISKYLSKDADYTCFILEHDLYLWLLRNKIEYRWYVNVFFDRDILMYNIDGITICFNNNDDALLFKLYWM
jgi:hypothetical protein